MGGAGPADRGGVGVGDRPADVVVTAGVGDPGRRRRHDARGPQHVCTASSTSWPASIDHSWTIKLLW